MDKLIPQIHVDASMREQMDIAEELKHFSIEFPRLYKQLMKSKQIEMYLMIKINQLIYSGILKNLEIIL